jgi:BolA family transcriptional regulator, general stress-responsive regulator
LLAYVLLGVATARAWLCSGQKPWHVTYMVETLPSRADRIAAILTSRFAPSHLAVVDDSAKHLHHAGAREGGQTHYSLTIVSAAFAGQGRVARHRMVNEALAEEFASGLHALALVARTPDEAG